MDYFFKYTHKFFNYILFSKLTNKKGRKKRFTETKRGKEQLLKTSL